MNVKVVHGRGDEQSISHSRVCPPIVHCLGNLAIETRINIYSNYDDDEREQKHVDSDVCWHRCDMEKSFINIY